MYGAPTNETEYNLRELISSLNLENKVFLKGRVRSDEVPDILKKAKILVSSQPETLRASGGFPTKLGEYLISGTPALISNVGENAKYVNNGTHIYFVQPGNYVAYAQKLSYILNNYEEAQNVAENGKRFLLENYSHIKKGKELLEFLKAI